MNSGHVFITTKQAIAILPNKKRIHTFRDAFILIGADWSRQDIISAIKKGKPQLTGKVASSMGHGLAIEDEHGLLFIETRKSKRKSSTKG